MKKHILTPMIFAIAFICGGAVSNCVAQSEPSPNIAADPSVLEPRQNLPGQAAEHPAGRCSPARPDGAIAAGARPVSISGTPISGAGSPTTATTACSGWRGNAALGIPTSSFADTCSARTQAFTYTYSSGANRRHDIA